jgi:acetyl-CoA C-acetyltransferase
MPEAVLVAAARSPIGRAHRGSLAQMRPDDLTAAIVQAALEQVPALDPTRIDDLYLGCGLPWRGTGLQHGPRGRDPARFRPPAGRHHQPLLLVQPADHQDGLPRDQGRRGRCLHLGRGRVRLPLHQRKLGRTARHDEPGFYPAQERSQRRSQGGEPWSDPREAGDLPDIYVAMGQTAENVAEMRGLSRRELDEFGVRSQNLAEKSVLDGFWKREITPVATPSGDLVTEDDGPRPGVTYEGVSALKPVFRPDGVVTAGNCCPLNDGAAAVVVMSDRLAAELDVTPLARIVSTGVTALSPEIMGLGPVEASKQALARAGMSIADIDLVEINEAFAAQVVPSYQDLGVDIDRLNINGGAIAVGHPFGMTGARLQATMLNSLSWHDKQTALVTMCVGGGQGMALVLERLA